jgi:hypothetical protein
VASRCWSGHPRIMGRFERATGRSPDRTPLGARILVP